MTTKGLIEKYAKSLEEKLSAYTEECAEPQEYATKINAVLYHEFSKMKLEPVFVGEYKLDQNNPTQTRVYSHQGLEACSPIPIKKGVIGRAFRTKKDQYVPDVTQDLEHVGCDPEMKGSELVLISWSEQYEFGKVKIPAAPIGVLDLDFKTKDALSLKDIKVLRNIWDTYGKKIFPYLPKISQE